MARVALVLASPFTFDARLAREASTLASRGHDVTAYVLAGPGLPEREDRDGYHVVRTSLPPWTRFTGPLRMVPLLRYFERHAALVERAVADGPDVLHAVDLDTLGPASRVCLRSGLPLIYEDRELCLEKIGQGTADWIGGPKRWVLDRITAHLRRRGMALESRWIPAASAFLSASPLYAKALADRHGREAVVLHNVPWNSDLAPNPELRRSAGLSQDTRVLLYQGTITPAGGAEECIAAAASLPENWALVFLGVTWMKERLQNRVRESGLAGRVRLLDPVPPSALPGYTRAADLGLATMKPANRGQAYSLANKVFEYMHAGLPVVASDLPGQGPFVRAHDTGVLIEEVSPASISAAVARLTALTDDERRTWGHRLRELARARFCWDLEQEKLLQVYDEVLSRRET